ncbi:family 4 glycosyl hydrolase [Vallitalea okinawensis]|uniref:family 4 glycosyl hydrolase n=1 Tax=Vallitalea okinawensis TaxID=2078660 RepID=UPI000CFDD3E8|nr:glycoside hydrolase [Vallitalea okinawensis]
MKLTVLGGGGVRSPFLAKSIVSNADMVGINEIVFMDNDKEKLFIYGKIAMNLAKRINPDIKFSITSDAKEALTDADFVITTLRVGGDEGRVSDERIALNNGLLGQETTGAGGFAMALRSVPALIDYCHLIREVAKPEALVFNFTNPSGIVTQALRSQGFDNVYGICDAPSEFIKQLREILDVEPEDFDITCFGLNHLSWFKDAKVKGKDVMGEILNHPKLYTDTEMRLFQPELTRMSGDLLLNEYLYFYYYREQAIDSINKSGKTRGETILEINNQMTKALKEINIDEDFEEAFKIFMTHYLIRENSYFSIESGQLRPKQLNVPSVQEVIETPDEGGYAGVALNFVRAYSTGERTLMVLSIPNEGAIEGLADDDVVEISCVIDKKKVTPIAVGEIKDMQMNLIKTIKYYERKTIEAILNKDRDMAIKALTVHPLINSYSLATELVDGYLEQYKDYVGEWN